MKKDKLDELMLELKQLQKDIDDSFIGSKEKLIEEYILKNPKINKDKKLMDNIIEQVEKEWSKLDDENQQRKLKKIN